MGRIIGESFQGYVEDQIKIRQNKLGQFTRDDNTHAYLTGKNSWIRLSSSVDIVESDKFKELQSKANIPSSYRSQNELARNYVLFGGVSRVTGRAARAGLVDSYNDTYTTNKAYGFNSTKDYGLTPMPFIEKIDVTPKNRGSLRFAEIKIKCFNPQQFFVIETLYLRLKYSVLLEWGHTMYFENDGTLQTTPYNDNVHQKFLNGAYETYGPSRQDQCLKDIEETRKKSNGNYDGFLGWVQNFKWNVTPDGHYDITLKAISYGDVIESLRLNKSLNTKQDEELPDNVTPAYSTTLGKILISLRQWMIDNQFSTADVIINGPQITAAEIKNITKLECDIYTKSSGIPLTSKELIGFKPKYNNGEFMGWIKLGSLLRIIESFLLEYDTSTTQRNPIFNMDYEYDDNYCVISPGLYSVNPGVCMIPSTFIFPDSTFNDPAITIPDPINSTSGTTKTFTSGTPLNLLQSPHNKFVGSGFLVQKSPANNGSKHWLLGRHMHIHVNMEFLINIIDTAIENKNELPLFDFLKTVCNEINQALCNNISLEPYYDTETNTIHIIDSNNTNELQKLLGQTIPSPTQINIGLLKPGEGSFVTDTSIESELSNKFATQIAIGAQNNNKNLSSESTTFSRWNKGLQDRLIKEKNPNSIVESEDEPNKKQESAVVLGYLTAYRFYVQSVGNTQGGKFGTLKFSDFKGDAAEFHKERKSIFEKDNKSTPKGFIPINLGLTLDGISGPRLFEKYTITEDFLPENYKDNIEFIIKGLKHTVDEKGWFTKIEGLSIPKEK